MEKAGCGSHKMHSGGKLNRYIVLPLLLLAMSSSASAQSFLNSTVTARFKEVADLIQPDESRRRCADDGVDWIGFINYRCEIVGSLRTDTLTIGRLPNNKSANLHYFVQSMTKEEADSLHRRIVAWAKERNFVVTECYMTRETGEPMTGDYLRSAELLGYFTRVTSQDGTIRTKLGFLHPNPPVIDACKVSGKLR